MESSAQIKTRMEQPGFLPILFVFLVNLWAMFLAVIKKSYSFILSALFVGVLCMCVYTYMYVVARGQFWVCPSTVFCLNLLLFLIRALFTEAGAH